MGTMASFVDRIAASYDASHVALAERRAAGEQHWEVDWTFLVAANGAHRTASPPTPRPLAKPPQPG